MTDVSLRADCAQCAALCCVALAFDASHLFAFDKPAGRACPNLSARDRCTIHARREESGFAGCVRFDCLGAGQRVTRLFAGHSWREDEATARSMFEAFGAMRRVHEMLLLLREAEKLPLTSEQATCRHALVDALERDTETPASLAALDRSGRAREVAAFLGSLRGCVER